MEFNLILFNINNKFNNKIKNKRNKNSPFYFFKDLYNIYILFCCIKMFIRLI